MLVLWMLAGVAAQAAPGSQPNTAGSEPFTEWQNSEIVRPAPRPAPERLGPGPHTLVISGQPPIKIDYKTGPACQKARDEVRRQLLQSINGGPRPIVSGTSAVCVPR